jgi:hypothetical protein
MLVQANNGQLLSTLQLSEDSSLGVTQSFAFHLYFLREIMFLLTCS